MRYSFPRGSLPGGGFRIVCGDAAALQGALQLDGEVLGDWNGALGRRKGALRLIAADGTILDEVRYLDRAPYSTLADGGGCSLRRREPWAPGDRPENWSAGQHTAWMRHRARGRPTREMIHIYLLGPGWASVDEVVVRRVDEGGSAMGPSLVPNGGFED